MEITPEVYRTITAIVDARVAEIKVMREDFNALTAAVRDLAQAQQHTEARLDEFAQHTDVCLAELTQAQQRTEARIDELAQAQQRTEARLAEFAQHTDARLAELTQAQQRTEARLTEFIQHTDARFAELAQAQQRTEEALRALAQAQQRTEEALHLTRQEVGALSEAIGMGLEDIARITLPGYLERHLGVHLAGELGEELRRWMIGPEGQEIEFDLYGEGQRDGTPVTVVGETKSRIYSDDVARFLKRLRSVEDFLAGEVIPVMFGYAVHPVATQWAREHGVLLVASYQR